MTMMMMHQEGREQKRIKLEDSSTITHNEYHHFLSTHDGEGEEERRPLCWYGFYCNRKNDSAHVKRYRHPSSKEEEDLMQKNARDQEEQKLGIEEEEQAHEMPEGWIRLMHTRVGVPFYMHRASGAISWTRPYLAPKIDSDEELRSHEIPLFPFSLVLHASTAASKREKQQRTKQFVEKRNKIIAALESKYGEIEEGELKPEQHHQEELQHQNETTKQHMETSKVTGTEDVIIQNEQTQGKSTKMVHKEEPRLVTRLSVIEKSIFRLIGRVVKNKKQMGNFLGNDWNVMVHPTRKRKTEAEKTELSSAGKTPISFLQEYCVNVLKTVPHYITTIQEDPSCPFLTVVEIAGKQYGKGAFLNKKQSKQMAAQATLNMLAPGAFPSSEDKASEEKKTSPTSSVASSSSSSDNLQDPYTVSIDDEAVLQFTNTKTPAQILQEYCNRSHATLDLVAEEVTRHDDSSGSRSRGRGKGNKQKVSPHERTFKVEATLDAIRVTAIGRNKRDAKQKAAQALLKQLHPDVPTWGHLLEVYHHHHHHAKTTATEEDNNDNNDNDNSSAVVVDHHHHHHHVMEPNMRLLEKLKEEMRKAFPRPTI